MAPAAIIDHPLIQYGREVCGDPAAQEIAKLAEESRRAAEAERDEEPETAARAKERLCVRESRGPRG